MTRKDELLHGAKAAIDAGENFLHVAAEKIAEAAEQGATQRQIATAVGKSAAWVNGLLKWRLAGYPETAFGPQKAARVEAARAFSQTKQEKPKSASTEDQARASTAKANAAKAKANAAEARAAADEAKANAAKAKADARKAKADRDKAFAGAFSPNGGKKTAHINAAQRDTLVKCLGMLGSDHAPERDNAATHVERLRKKIGTSWDDLIVEAA